MPVINRPITNAQRDAALRNAKTRKDSIPAPPEIPFMPGTITKLDIFQPAYHGKYLAVSTAKNVQTSLTGQIAQVRKLAIYYEQDFIDNLNKGIRRGLIEASRRSLYQLDVNDNTLPYIGSENDITTWGQNIADGEAARLAIPGEVPVTFPSAGEVSTAVGNFVSINLNQANAKDNLNIAQEALESENIEADKLILKLWNEIETAFNEGNKPSMRNRAREWGVVYVPSPGEAPSPDEFSIMGTITEQATNNPINEAEILVVQTGLTVLSGSDGDYFIGLLPPGTYTLQISKTGFQTLTLPGIVVSAATITQRDAQLSPAVTATGTVSGTVTLSGSPAAGVAVSIEGLALPSILTDPTGHYSISNVPAGMQTVKAQLPPIMGGGFQTQALNVTAGAEVAANFAF
ncbi:MAG: carboxypeptidase regulatory-like domain-containing protein [Bacteroidia bacterium]